MGFDRIVVFPEINPIIKKCIDDLDAKSMPRIEGSPAIIQKKKNDYIVQCNRCNMFTDESLTYPVILDNSSNVQRYCQVCTGVIAMNGTGIIMREDD